MSTGAEGITELTYLCGHTKAESIGGSLNRWGIKEVAYCINGYPTSDQIGLTKKDIEDIVAESYRLWTEVCDIKFKRVNDPNFANIIMSGARGKRAGFDGPYGVLAYCYLPQGDNFTGQVELEWDMDEPWIKDGNNGIRLLNVTCHELGHGIGLDHNNFPRQLMNPTYAVSIASPQSHDIADAVARYGKPVLIPAPPAPTPTPTPTPGVVWGKFLDDQGRVWAGQMTLQASKIEF